MPVASISANTSGKTKSCQERVRNMSDTATQLLNAFSSLSAEEQHEVMLALLRKSGELRGSTITDDQLVTLAEEVFLSLDAKELNGIEDNKR
jgi:hypothetical protein